MLLKKSQDSIIIYKKIVLGSAQIYYHHIFTISNMMDVLLIRPICYDLNKLSKTYKRLQCHSED